MTRARAALLTACLASAACAASPKRSSSPEAYGEAPASMPSASAGASAPAQPGSPPSAAPQGGTGTDTAASSPSRPSGAGPADASSARALAFQRAGADVEASQRELDVAAGDCRSACRALASMDRAAGRLCELAQGPSELQRCDDAKRRVYSARDRVRSTCGECPGGPSVERGAPIPSVR